MSWRSMAFAAIIGALLGGAASYYLTHAAWLQATVSAAALVTFWAYQRTEHWRVMALLKRER